MSRRNGRKVIEVVSEMVPGVPGNRLYAPSYVTGGEYDLALCGAVPQETDEERMHRLFEDGREIWLAVNSFMVSDNTYQALEIICRGNNWQRISMVLAGMFHGGEQESLRVIQARGYDRLRGLVTTCARDLREENGRLPRHYPRLVHRLFTSAGYLEP